MTRRDIIIVAVLANIGILSILFMLAFRTEEEKVAEPTEIAYHIEAPPLPEDSAIEIDIPKNESIDEVDTVLEEITPLNSEIVVNKPDDDGFQFLEQDQPVVAVPSSPASRNSQTSPSQNEARYVEVTIKKGDALEKIARANRTSVGAIMRANNLKSDKLKIGQVLRIPINTINKAAVTPIVNTQSNVVTQENQYYTLKNGDNLWKIAKQFHTKVDALLTINNLDEDSARKLKIGDQIRVR